MVAFLTVHKMTKRQPAKKTTGAFMAVANMHIFHFSPVVGCGNAAHQGLAEIPQFAFGLRYLREHYILRLPYKFVNKSYLVFFSKLYHFHQLQPAENNGN